ncbi:MAG: FtsQ-type POTRA domain-containing protein [Actinobacteria bacterium]|nr:FtsQ-type POTRA domain-containing protein [Actinomycetota bacterium]
MKRVLWALAVLVPVAAVLAWIGWFSPWFALDTVQVRIGSASEAAGPLTTAEVDALVQVPDGTPLLRISPSEVEERVATLPQVASVTVTRSWPTTLVVDVERRVPVAAVPTSTGAYDVVDITGAVIRQSPGPVAGVPTVRAAGPGLEASIAVVRDMPEWLREKVEGIEATTRNDVTLQLRNGSVVIWGSREENEFKAEVLRVLLKVKALRYDVSAPGTPATSDNPTRPTALPSATVSPSP